MYQLGIKNETSNKNLYEEIKEELEVIIERDMNGEIDKKTFQDGEEFVIEVDDLYVCSVMDIGLLEYLGNRYDIFYSKMKSDRPDIYKTRTLQIIKDYKKG